MISTEVIVAVLGIIGIIFGGWRTRVTNKSVADKEREVADAKAKLLAAEGNLAEAKAEAEQQTALARIAERQQTLLEQHKASQDRIDQENLQRWGTVAALFNDVRAGETNIHNVLVQISTTMGEISAVQKMLPQMIQDASTQAIRETANVVGAEIGAAMAREFAIKNAERTMHPFPDAEDKRWRDDFILPIVPDVFIHKEPHFDDDVKLKKSCSKINPAGETLRLIEEPSISAIAVYKIEDGVPCYGWLHAKFVKIGQPTEPIPA